jgi:hypothetical protein
MTEYGKHGKAMNPASPFSHSSEFLRDSHITTASTTGYCLLVPLNANHRHRKGLVNLHLSVLSSTAIAPSLMKWKDRNKMVALRVPSPV